VAVSSLLIAKDLGVAPELRVVFAARLARRPTSAGRKSAFRRAFAFGRNGGIALAQVRAVLTRLPGDGPSSPMPITARSWGFDTDSTPRPPLRGRHPFQSQNSGGLVRARVHRGGVAAQIPTRHWQRVCWGQGTKGRWRRGFVALRVAPHAESGASAGCCANGRWTNDERKFYVLNVDASVSLKELVASPVAAWPIEQQYASSKTNWAGTIEGRTYPGWSHHTVLTAIAFVFLQLERRRSPDEPGHVAPCADVGARDHGGPLHRQQSQVVELLINFQRNPPLRR